MTGIGTQIKNALGWFLTKLKGNVVNNLTSTSTDLPLSAAKGKDLQDQITSLNTKIYIISDNIDNLSLMNKVENYSSFAITYRGWESRYVPDGNNSFFLCSKDSIICISLSGKMYKCERRNLNWIQM